LNIAVTKRVRRNDEIEATEVRVIGSDGEQAGVMGIAAAIELAEDEGLDLVEVSPMADPPVCRIMDFGKYLFEQNKKNQSAKRSLRNESKNRFTSRKLNFVRERTKAITR
jgi:translation initiation factor IF-3